MGVAHGPLELVRPQSLGWDNSHVNWVSVSPGKASVCRPSSTACTGLICPLAPSCLCVLFNELPALESVSELAFEEPKPRYQVSDLETYPRLWLS